MYNEGQKRYVKLDEDQENTKENLITIYEKVTLETAGKIWECSIILGRYLMKQAYFDKLDLKDKSILELGCGTGILSIMLAKQGAKLWATDLPQVEALCEQNFTKNQVNDRIKFKLLDWNQSKHKTQCLIDQQKFDYIVASDPIYNEKTLEAFFNQLQILYSFLNPIMYLAYKQRHDEIDKQIEDRLEQAGLWFKQIESSQLDDLWKSAKCVIYKIGKF